MKGPLALILGLFGVALVKSRDAAGSVHSAWVPPNRAAPYLSTLQAAESAYGLPPGMLARMAYQESRFRADIISGEVTSSAGAIGIMQIVPRWHPDVNPRDPEASIWYAARYVRDLKLQFGSWSLALAAYNWGPGNLSTKGYANAPSETRNYVNQISADIPGVFA